MFAVFFLREPIFADHWEITKIGTPKTSATRYLSSSLLNINDYKVGSVIREMVFIVRVSGEPQ